MWLFKFKNCNSSYKINLRENVYQIIINKIIRNNKKIIM